MSVHISEKKQDFMRQSLFKDEYGLDTKIWITNFNDEKWNWDKVILNFTDSLGKNYGLIEHYKPGSDNSTDFVIFEYTDKSDKLMQERFDADNCKKGEIFLTAEKRMASLMRQRLEGKNA